jgi:hypothetical protein
LALIDWEAAWAAYDEDTYRFVIDHVGPEDVVLDIGAGDLRLARRLAAAARKVYALERSAAVLAQAHRSALCPVVGQVASWPNNLIVVCADAVSWQFPSDVSVAVLLMRHCRSVHFAGYLARLRGVGCRRLITNARWKMGVEVIDLQSAEAYDPDRVGWYACACGSIGFTPGDLDRITDQVLDQVAEVVACPNCGAG